MPSGTSECVIGESLNNSLKWFDIKIKKFKSTKCHGQFMLGFIVMFCLVSSSWFTLLLSYYLSLGFWFLHTCSLFFLFFCPTVFKPSVSSVQCSALKKMWMRSVLALCVYYSLFHQSFWFTHFFILDFTTHWWHDSYAQLNKQFPLSFH